MGEEWFEEGQRRAEDEGEVPVEELEEVTLAIDYFGVGWDGAEAASSWYWVVAVIAVSVEARVQIDATIIALNILDKHQLVINLIKLRCQNEAGGHDQV